MGETNLVAAYQNAVRRLQEAQVKAQRLADFISDAGKKLEYWPTVTFSNIDFKFPSVERQYVREVDAAAWPSAAEVAQAIVEYHDAKTAADVAWDAIDEDGRVGLQEPRGWTGARFRE